MRGGSAEHPVWGFLCYTGCFSPLQWCVPLQWWKEGSAPCYWVGVLYYTGGSRLRQAFFVQIDCIPYRRAVAICLCYRCPKFSRNCPMGLDLAVQDPACSRDAPIRGSPEDLWEAPIFTVEALEIPALSIGGLWVSPTISDGLGHHISRGTAELHMICLLMRGHMPPIYYLVVF